MKVPFSTLPEGVRFKLPRLLAFFIAFVFMLSMTVNTTSPIRADEITIFPGPNLPTRSAERSESSEPAFEGVYTDQWAVQLVLGTDADSVAGQLGMENLGPIGELPGYYLFRATRSVGRNENLTASLRSVPNIIWAEQQIERERVTRVPTDPLVPAQWHLNNTGQNGGTPAEDINVLPAWNAGVTGNGVTIAIVDDGLEINHPDIAPNYFAQGSFDFISNETNPTGNGAAPSDPTGDAHGTSVGGLAAASDDGGKCGVGVAYNAQLAGIRLIGDPNPTDAKEAQALGFQQQQNEVYNNSWGPLDDGKKLQAPGALALQALSNGVTLGRGGLGNIYVWSAGNGYQAFDHSNADGYANSRFVIAVGASDEDGIHSWYSEAGANVMVTAPSQGDRSGLPTTDLAGPVNGYNRTGVSGEPGDVDCTGNFNGTSASAPIVAGVTALMLEANPALTWRDVMHVLIETAEKNDPNRAGVWQWQTNAAGYNINYLYGFGRVDAGAAVALADTWTNVPPNVTPYDSGIVPVNVAIPDGVTGQDGKPAQGPAVVKTISVPKNFTIEHVEVYIDADHSYRGDLGAQIVSPSGTVSGLLFNRLDGGGNYENWRTMSLRHWGEQSAGTWTFAIGDFVPSEVGVLNSVRLVIHGYRSGEGQTELVDNGGFEQLDANGNPVSWTVRRSTKDKVKCQKPGKPNPAYAGICAFRFKGNPGEASAVMQKLDFAGISFQRNDILDFLVQMDSPSSTLGKIKMVVKYSDGTPPTKVSGAPVITDEYDPYGWQRPLDSSNVTMIKLTLAYRAPGGKMLLDEVSVLHLPLNSPARGLIPLPGSKDLSEWQHRPGGR